MPAQTEESDSKYKNNCKELLLLDQFRTAVQDLENIKDPELRRFLRSRNYDIKAAEEMLRKSVVWRKAVQLDEALSFDIPPEIVEHFAVYTDGFDVDGRVVMYFPAGRWEIRKMLGEGWRKDMERHLYKYMAVLQEKVERSGDELFVTIVDLAGMTYWKIAHYETVQMILQVFRDYEANFPERLKSAVIVNAPWALNCIFPLIKPLLTGTTLQKVQIFDSNKTNYLAALREIIPEKGFPAKFREYYMNDKNEDDCVQLQPLPVEELN